MLTLEYVTAYVYFFVLLAFLNMEQIAESSFHLKNFQTDEPIIAVNPLHLPSMVWGPSPSHARSLQQRIFQLPECATEQWANVGCEGD